LIYQSKEGYTQRMAVTEEAKAQKTLPKIARFGQKTITKRAVPENKKQDRSQ
jgi:hypothetical protein